MDNIKNRNIDNYCKGMIQFYRNFCVLCDEDNMLRKLSISFNEDNMYKAFSFVYENNYDYLITPGFLSYLIYINRDYDISELLLSLADENNRFRLYKLYYQAMRNNWCYKRLNKQEKKADDLIYHYMSIAYERRDIIRRDFEMLRESFFCLMAYVFVNKKDFEEYKIYANQYLDDYKSKIDELRIQGIIKEYEGNDGLYYYAYSTDQLGKYILSKLNEIPKEIR